MALTVTMPQLGESVTEGTIARWLKQPGELVGKYESIAEVVTDKVNAEIPSPSEGSMGDHIAKEGDVVAVGAPICTIESVDQGTAQSAWHQGTPGTAQSTAPDAAESPAPSAAVAVPESGAPPPPAPSAVPAIPSPAPSVPAAAAPPAPAQPHAWPDHHLTPAVRMLVREHGVDLSQVTGTGLGGRISKRDVLEYVQRRDAGAAAPAAAAPSVGVDMEAPADDAPPGDVAPAGASVSDGDEVIPLTPARRAIADHMVRSRQTSPHAWLMMEVDMSRVWRIRAALREEFERRYATRLTFLPFVARAVCEALRRHPTLNASWSDQGIIVRRDIHLGIAVALEESLIVPVIRNADRLSIAGLAMAMGDLGERARNNRLKLDEIQGGTFTLNNTGALGTVLTSAIINQPQAGILAMDAVVKRPVVIGDAIAIRPIMNLGLSFDHRVNDGLQAARFVRTVKELLEGLDESTALM